jgi:S1-C subfamily serine protease
MKQDLRTFRLLSATAIALTLGLVPTVSTAMIRGPGNDPGGVTARSASEVDPEPSGLDQALRSVVVIEPGPAGSGPASGSGSGFVFDAGGHVITNAHVVGAARSVTVGLIDGRRFQAEVVGTDPRTDIAVVRLPAGVDLPPALDLVDATDAGHGVGSPVFALGNPMGFRFSVTSGVISGAGRTYDVLTPVEFLQHDAALNPGNSGGPLVDSLGRVLGVNTATPPETIFDIGIGLAIPAALVADVARRLVADGTIPRGALGVRVSHADTAVAAALGAEGVQGALVDEVEPGGAADRAGVRAGDLILAIDRTPVALPREVLSQIMAHRPGDRVTLDFFRNGQRRTVAISLQQDVGDVQGPARGVGLKRSEDEPDLGLQLEAAEGRTGAVVTSVTPGSAAQIYGLGAGDRIEAINGRTIGDASEFSQRLGNAAGGLVVLRVERPGLGVRHVNIPRTWAEGLSRQPGIPSEQQSGPL